MCVILYLQFHNHIFISHLKKHLLVNNLQCYTFIKSVRFHKLSFGFILPYKLQLLDVLDFLKHNQFSTKCPIVPRKCETVKYTGFQIVVVKSHF